MDGESAFVVQAIVVLIFRHGKLGSDLVVS